jgi:hypothetical protein
VVGLPWEQHIAFLDDSKKHASSIEERVRAGVRACAGRPAVLCYTIGIEIPASIRALVRPSPCGAFPGAPLPGRQSRGDPTGLVRLNQQNRQPSPRREGRCSPKAGLLLEGESSSATSITTERTGRR